MTEKQFHPGDKVIVSNWDFPDRKEYGVVLSTDYDERTPYAVVALIFRTGSSNLEIPYMCLEGVASFLTLTPPQEPMVMDDKAARVNQFRNRHSSNA